MTHPAPDPAEAWAQALDELEAQLRRQEAAVDMGAPAPQPTIPDVEGPVPAALVARAMALLDRNHRLEDRAAAAMAELRKRQPRFATGTERGTELGRL